MDSYAPESPKKYQPKHAYKIARLACNYCEEVGRFSVGKFLDPSGQIKYPWYCTACYKRTVLFEPKHEHLVYTAVFDTAELNQCEVCGKDGAEGHHWAPRKLFGNECERWPMGFLCQYCHARWHQIVTPNINEGPTLTGNAEPLR